MTDQLFTPIEFACPGCGKWAMNRLNQMVFCSECGFYNVFALPGELKVKQTGYQSDFVPYKRFENKNGKVY